MANEVINPYQLFRDDDGDPLAGGSLRIFVNRTSTIGTAYSDSELTIAQEVDPYRLDQFGRVRGDLRWQGERTVQVRDFNDAQIRVLDDVVTLVDISGGRFSFNYESVAAMVADSSLQAGDIAYTTSYNAGQRQGGARYLITESSEPVDGYLVHDITGTTPQRQARLLDTEANNNFYVAGAIGTGAADDSVAVQRLLTLGGDIECSNGVFAVSGLTLSLSARIYGDGTLIAAEFSSDDMLTLSGEDQIITLDGITIDGNAANQTAETAKASIRSTITATAGNESIISFTNVAFQNGPQFDCELDGADDGETVLFTFGSCRFIGGFQSSTTPFIAAAVQLTNGVTATFEDCYFDLTEAPATDGGRCAISYAGTVFANPGEFSVASSTFNRMGAAGASLAAINAALVGRMTVADCRFLTCTDGAIRWGAELTAVTIQGNTIESGDQLTAALEAVTTAQDAGGNWSIQANELVNIPGNAILLDGESTDPMGTNAGNVEVSNNLCDAPTAAAIVLGNIEDPSVRDNFVNMEAASGINGIEANAALNGAYVIQGNTVVNIDGTAIEYDGVGADTVAITCQGNTIENLTNNATGILIEDAAAVRISENVMRTAIGNTPSALIDVGNITTAILANNSYEGGVPAAWIRETATITALATRDNFVAEIDNSIELIQFSGGVGVTIEVRAAYHRIENTDGGVATVTDIDFGPNIRGFMVTFQREPTSGNSVTFTDGANLNLGAATRVLATDEDTLTLICEGLDVFSEIAFSDNS